MVLMSQAAEVCHFKLALKLISIGAFRPKRSYRVGIVLGSWTLIDNLYGFSTFIGLSSLFMTPDHIYALVWNVSSYATVEYHSIHIFIFISSKRVVSEKYITVSFGFHCICDFWCVAKQMSFITLTDNFGLSNYGKVCQQNKWILDEANKAVN